MPAEKTRGYVLGAVAAASYGLNPLFALPLYGAGMGVDSVLFYRYLLAVIMLGTLMAFRRHSFALGRRDILPLAVMGLLFSFSSLTLFASYNYMDAGIASTILFLYPVMVAVIMAAFFHERITAATVVSILLACTGIGLLYKGGDGATLSLIGVGLVILSSLCYAIYIVGVNRSSLRDLPTEKLTFYALLFGLSVYLVRLRGGVDLQPVPSPLLWINAVSLALFPTIISLVTMAGAIRRNRAGLSDPNRPIGSFLFLGPTGVGKTELAKALAQALFDDERNMVRIDMTEYMEKFSVSRLIGAPPGYVGYEEGGQLTEAVRRKPYSVVLFDEVEKAHPDVFNILLQVLDDGRITDSQGRTVDFKNTVIILTSNLGSDIILNDLEQRRAQGSNELSDEARKQIDLLLKSKFRPEFLNRLDEIVYYKSLTKDEMRKIVDLQLNDLRKRMDEGKHLKLEVTTAAKDFIIDSAYDSVYGARPIKRFIQSRVETLIAKAIIQGSYAEGNTLTVDYDGSALVLR